MPTINDKKYLNLQEQVLKNKNDIAAIISGNVVLGELGIKVVGQGEDTTALPNPEVYTGEYGDAYLIGTTPPYDYYIFTRPFQGQTSPQWFNLGEFPVPGPQGEPGIGITPTILIGQVTEGDTPAVTITGTPTTPILNFTIPRGRPGADGRAGISCTHEWIGTTLSITSASGTSSADLRGPQGLPSLPVKIVDEVNTVDALPAPTESIRQDAYIVDISGTKFLYVIIGEVGGTLNWFRVGPMAGSAGSEIIVNGEVVSRWNANTKLDRTTQPLKVYGTDDDGYDQLISIDKYPNPFSLLGSGAIVRRTSGGGVMLPSLSIGQIPDGNEAVNYSTVLDAVYNGVIEQLMSKVYPVGSFYMSANNMTNPASILGVGTWQAVENVFLFAGPHSDLSSPYFPGATGGSFNASLVSHRHVFKGVNSNFEGYRSPTLFRYNADVSYQNPAVQYGSYSSSDGYITIDYEGEDPTGKNMPPYLSVYVWQRIS